MEEDFAAQPDLASPPGGLPGDLALVARGAGLGVAGGLVRQALTAVTVLVLARLLTPADFGLAQLGISCAVLLAVLGKAGLNTAGARYVAIYLAAGRKREARGVIQAGLLWSGLLAVGLFGLVVAVAPGLAGVFHKPEFAGPLVCFAAWMPPAVLTMISTAAVLARGSARPHVVVRDLLMPAGCLLLAAAGAALWPRATVVGLAYAGASLVGMVVSLRYLGRSFADLRGVQPIYHSALLWGTALPLMLTDLAAVGLTQADVVLAGRLLPVEQVGIYAAASRLAILGALALTALNQILAPVISRLHHQGRTLELDSLLKTVNRLCLTVSMPLLALLVGLAGPLMGVLGPRFTAGSAALVVATLGVLVNVGTGSVGYALMMAGYQWLAFATNLVCLGLLVGLMWWLVPLYGVLGAAIGMAASTSLVNLVRLVLVRRLLRANPLGWPMVKALAAGGVTGLLAWGLASWAGLSGGETLPRLLGRVAGISLVAVACYTALVLLLGVETSDRAAARALWDRIRGRLAGNGGEEGRGVL